MWLNDNHIKAILFDVDGTLLNTSEGLFRSVHYILDYLHLPQPANEQMREFVGPPIQESLIRYGGLSKEEAQQGANVIRDFYKHQALFEASLNDGIIPALEQLRNMGFKIGVATYKRADYALDILVHFGIAPLCDVIHGADNENRLTKADIIQMCCEELGGGKDGTLLVGDTEHDARGAAMAGIKFGAVTWGFGFSSTNVKSSYPIDVVWNNVNDIFN